MLQIEGPAGPPKKELNWVDLQLDLEGYKLISVEVYKGELCPRS